MSVARGPRARRERRRADRSPRRHARRASDGRYRGVRAQAERERTARVTLATAEFEAAQKMIEAARMYETSHEGLRLRWMNILYELGQQSGTNTIMLVPSVMPEAGWPPVGMYGFKELPKGQNAKAQAKKEAANQEQP